MKKYDQFASSLKNIYDLKTHDVFIYNSLDITYSSHSSIAPTVSIPVSAVEVCFFSLSVFSLGSFFEVGSIVGPIKETAKEDKIDIKDGIEEEISGATSTTSKHFNQSA